MTCPLCHGPIVYMGALGSREHYQCRNCGAYCSALPVFYDQDGPEECDEENNE